MYRPNLLVPSKLDFGIRSFTLSLYFPSVTMAYFIAKIDINVKLPPPYKRTMWDYKNAGVSSIRNGRRYIELKLSIPMAEIISTVMTCKYNRGTNYHTSL